MPGSDRTCLESSHPPQTDKLYKPQQVYPTRNASFCVSFFASASFAAAEQVILDVLLVNLSMLLLLLQTVVDRSSVVFLLMAHQLLLCVPPVTQFFVRMRYQLSKPCLIPSVGAELLIKELSSFVIIYLMKARQKAKL